MSDSKTAISIDNSGIDPQTNFSLNPTFAAVVDARMARRKFLKGSVGAAVAAFIGGNLAACSSSDDGERCARAATSSGDKVPSDTLEWQWRSAFTVSIMGC